MKPKADSRDAFAAPAGRFIAQLRTAGGALQKGASLLAIQAGVP
jgi:hypothetical protein